MYFEDICNSDPNLKLLYIHIYMYFYVFYNIKLVLLAGNCQYWPQVCYICAPRYFIQVHVSTRTFTFYLSQSFIKSETYLVLSPTHLSSFEVGTHRWISLSLNSFTYEMFPLPLKDKFGLSDNTQVKCRAILTENNS